MEITKLLICAIGIAGFLFSVIDCVPSSPVSSSPIVTKKVNSVNNLSSPPPPPPSSSSSPLSPTINDQSIDGSFNSLTSDSLVGKLNSVPSSPGESTPNLKPSNPPVDYHPIRSTTFLNNFGKVRGGSVNFGSPSSSPSSSSSSSLTSSFSSSFSPSKLFPSLFSSSTSSRISSHPLLGSSFALRPINRLLELFPRNDDHSSNGRDNFPPKVYHHQRPQLLGDKIHADQHGNSLSSPVFYSNDLYPDLTKQGSISRLPWFTNTFRGHFQPTRRSTIRSIVDRIFG